MSKLGLVCLLATAIFGWIAPAMAGMTNMGEDRTTVQSPNVLTPDTGRDNDRILYCPSENVELGDQLAAFVDQGGTVVLGAFCTYTSGYYLSGAIMTAGYSPVWSPSGSNHFMTSGYAGDGTTCIHMGVSAYDCTYRDYLALRGSGIVDGHYYDGEIGHAYRMDYQVIYSNGAGAAVLGSTGQWARLIVNTCACSNPCSPVERSTWGQIKGRF